jgi:ABC-2 type transport system ATP-binding protein
MKDAPLIWTDGLTKHYGKMEAVRNLNLMVRPNRITGFLGRNGAGKSTTIKMILGMIRPTSGEGTAFGLRITDAADSIALRKRIAYVSEDKRLYDYLTVEQMVRFTRAFYPDWRPEVVTRLLKEYELPSNRRVRALSKGMRTKLALLLAFARRPDLLILDEPSEGLDPVGVEHLLQTLVGTCTEGTTVFFSSHQIDEVERIADHVSILEKGSLVLDESLDRLRQTYRRIDVVFPSAPVEREFQIAGVERIRTNGRQMSVFASSNADAVVERAHSCNAISVQASPVALRDLFLESVKEN